MVARKVITAANYDQIASRLEAAIPEARIASEFGISVGSVSNLRKELTKMRQPEGVTKDGCRRLARANGLVFHQIEGKGTNGVPDTLAGHVDQDGLVMIEFKVPEKDPTPQQQKRIAEYREAGQRCAVCRSIDDYRRAVGLL